MLSILGPILLCEWNLQTWEEALITTVNIYNYFCCKDLKIENAFFFKPGLHLFVHRRDNLEQLITTLFFKKDFSSKL